MWVGVLSGYSDSPSTTTATRLADKLLAPAGTTRRYTIAMLAGCVRNWIVSPLAYVPPKAAAGMVNSGLLCAELAGMKLVAMLPEPTEPTVSPVTVYAVLVVNVAVHNCSIEPMPCGVIGCSAVANVPDAEVSKKSVTEACTSAGVYTLETYVGADVVKL